MLNNRMQNLDTKKEISIPKRRLRPPRYYKKKTSRYQKKMHPFLLSQLLLLGSALRKLSVHPKYG